MKKFIFLVALPLFVCFAETGCKKGAKESPGAQKSSEEKTEEKTKAKDLSLTEKEVKSFVNALPAFIEFAKSKEKEITAMVEKEKSISGLEVANEYIEYKEEIDKVLGKYGFNLESFSSTYAKVMSTFAYGQMDKAIGAGGENMKKMLDNPMIPEKEKEEIRKNLKEYEESEEMKACKGNWEIVEKYEDEIKEILEEK